MPNFHSAPAGTITFRRQGCAHKSNLVARWGGVGVAPAYDRDTRTVTRRFTVHGFGYFFPGTFETAKDAKRVARTIAREVMACATDDQFARVIARHGGAR